MIDRRLFAAIMVASVLIIPRGMSANQPKEITIFCAAGLSSSF